MHHCVISFRERRMFSYLTEHTPISSHLTLFTRVGVPVPAIRSEEKINKQTKTKPGLANSNYRYGRSPGPKSRVFALGDSCSVVQVVILIIYGQSVRYPYRKLKIIQNNYFTSYQQLSTCSTSTSVPPAVCLVVLIQYTCILFDCSEVPFANTRFRKLSGNCF